MLNCQWFLECWVYWLLWTYITHTVNKTANSEDKLKYKTFLTHIFNNDDYEVFSGKHLK